MQRKWGNILAYTCWGIAGALALLNLILMIVELTAGSRGIDYGAFQGGNAAIVFRSFVNIIWQSAIFGVAGAILFSIRRAE